MSSPPLHATVSDSLRREIHSELLHGPLPSEAELQKRFGVSRSVVRQALATLEAEGLVQKVRGKGSFVLPVHRIRRLVQSLNGLGFQVAETGATVETRLLAWEMVNYKDAPTEWAGKALRLQRLRSGYGYPLAVIETWLPPHLSESLSPETLDNASLHELMKIRAGITLSRSIRNVYAVPAADPVAGLLGVSPGAPLLLLSGTTYDADNFPVEVFSTWHRGDRVMFQLERYNIAEQQETTATA
ncbi:MAG: GntR family transcriptional regulator [Cardiobacteriaceae bacterium]|nr:GntR family transcriptional regulator [Cardiobacteriaceae bacterium]